MRSLEIILRIIFAALVAALVMMLALLALALVYVAGTKVGAALASLINP